MLKLTRRVQQGIVITPKDNPESTLVIRVLELVPGSVSLGFEGEDFQVVRSEIYREGDYAFHKANVE